MQTERIVNIIVMLARSRKSTDRLITVFKQQVTGAIRYDAKSLIGAAPCSESLHFFGWVFNSKISPS